MKITHSLLLGLALFSFGLNAAVNVAEVQRKINATGAQWVAKSNWVSELPANQVKRMLGSQELGNTTLDYSDAYAKGATYETVDWRNMNGVNWLGPVLNQGNCGSCVAFATIGTLEAQISITNGTPWLKPQLSPQALFACGGGSCDRGWMPGPAASYVKSKGVVDNACAPYTMGSDGKDVQCKQFCQNQSARTTKSLGSSNPSGWFGSVQKVKEALKKGPLVTTMTVYEDFLTYAGGIYKSVGSHSVGGHAVSIVGYNDQERYWIVRNSWGEDWGEKGFVRVSWDDISGVGGSTVAFTVANQSNTVSVMSPAENDYVSGEMIVQTQAERSEDFSVKLMRNGLEVSTLPAREVANLRMESIIDTASLSDGKYELMAVSNTDASVKSLIRGFTVANSMSTMSLSFQAADGVDLNKPVKDRLEFDVIAQSTPVTMQKVDFMVTKLDGTLVTKRTTDVVMGKMKLGFRFNVVPDGDYLIFFRGTLPAGGKVYTVDSNKIQIKNLNH